MAGNHLHDEHLLIIIIANIRCFVITKSRESIPDFHEFKAFMQSDELETLPEFLTFFSAI